ncbi:MAG: NADAR family protein [Parachlamydia sp.]|nr:NADAR family protein [Parachlamydia sp.]
MNQLSFSFRQLSHSYQDERHGYLGIKNGQVHYTQARGERASFSKITDAMLKQLGELDANERVEVLTTYRDLAQRVIQKPTGNFIYRLFFSWFKAWVVNSCKRRADEESSKIPARPFPPTIEEDKAPLDALSIDDHVSEEESFIFEEDETAAEENANEFQALKDPIVKDDEQPAAGEKSESKEEKDFFSFESSGEENANEFQPSGDLIVKDDEQPAVGEKSESQEEKEQLPNEGENIEAVNLQQPVSEGPIKSSNEENELKDSIVKDEEQPAVEKTLSQEVKEPLPENLEAANLQQPVSKAPVKIFKKKKLAPPECKTNPERARLRSYLTRIINIKFSSESLNKLSETEATILFNYISGLRKLDPNTSYVYADVSFTDAEGKECTPGWYTQELLSKVAGYGNSIAEAREQATGRNLLFALSFGNAHAAFKRDEPSIFMIDPLPGSTNELVEFPNVEFYFQHCKRALYAASIADPKQQEVICQAFRDDISNPKWKDPGTAHSAGYEGFTQGVGVFDSKAWDAIKVEVMRAAVYAKFNQHPLLRLMLEATAIQDREFVQVKVDPEWGPGPDGKGKNLLGVVLEEVRDAFLKNKQVSLPAVLYPSLAVEEVKAVSSSKVKKIDDLLHCAVTLNSHGSYSVEKFRLPSSVYVLAPHPKGFSQPYSLTSPSDDASFEAMMYEAEANGFSLPKLTSAGWRLYRPGEMVNNLLLQSWSKNEYAEWKERVSNDDARAVLRENGKVPDYAFIPARDAKGEQLEWKGSKKEKIKIFNKTSFNEIVTELRKKTKEPVVLIPFCCNARKVDDCEINCVEGKKEDVQALFNAEK